MQNSPHSRSESSGVGRRSALGVGGEAREFEPSLLADDDFRSGFNDDDDDDFLDELDLLGLLLDFDDDDDEDLVEERRGAFSLSSTSPVQWTIFLPSADGNGENRSPMGLDDEGGEV